MLGRQTLHRRAASRPLGQEDPSRAGNAPCQLTVYGNQFKPSTNTLPCPEMNLSGVRSTQGPSSSPARRLQFSPLYPTGCICAPEPPGARPSTVRTKGVGTCTGVSPPWIPQLCPHPSYPNTAKGKGRETKTNSLKIGASCPDGRGKRRDPGPHQANVSIQGR